MINLKKIIIATFIITISFNIKAETDSINTTSLNSNYSDMKTYLGLYISGTVCTYGALATSIAFTSEFNESILLPSITLGALSPVLIHIGQGKARFKADDLVESLPDNHKLKMKYRSSRTLYFSGIAFMVAGIVSSTIAMPASIINENDVTGPMMYGVALCNLIIRDVLWGSAMKRYVDIAKEIPSDNKGIKLSLSPQFNSKEKTGGLAFNVHF